MHRTQFHLDIRGKEHRTFTFDCSAGCFVRRFGTVFDRLRQRRTALVHQRRDKLSSGEVVVIEIVAGTLTRSLHGKS